MSDERTSWASSERVVDHLEVGPPGTHEGQMGGLRGRRTLRQHAADLLEGDGGVARGDGTGAAIPLAPVVHMA